MSFVVTLYYNYCALIVLKARVQIRIKIPRNCLGNPVIILTDERDEPLLLVLGLCDPLLAGAPLDAGVAAHLGRELGLALVVEAAREVGGPEAAEPGVAAVEERGLARVVAVAQAHRRTQTQKVGVEA